MPYKDKRNKTSPWIGQIKEGERKKRKAFRTKREAILWEQLQRVGESQTATVCLVDWMNGYLDYAKQQFVEKTYEEKLYAFKLLLQHKQVRPVMPVSDLTPMIVLNHLQQQEKNRSGNAANKDRKNLRAAWAWGISYLSMPRENPFGIVEKRGEKRHPRHIPSLNEFWKVYKVAETDQDRCMLLCYLHTGARREELFRLRWVDVDFINRRVRLFWRKNRLGTWKETWLDMSTDMDTALRKQQMTAGKEKFVFLRKEKIPYLKRQHWLNRLCKKSGVKKFGFHGIRHLTASLLAESGVPLVEIQHHLRHEHLSTTERYIHRLKKNRVAIEALPGLKSASESSGPYKARAENSEALQQSAN